ncbi:MAG TPA: hypothetical protein VI727_01430 [Candidatus Brocadiaceae bacterium]|nr:hypothetical protein [Candidatus Brocadiaceae bacterium]
MPTNVTESEYLKAKLILNEIEQPLTIALIDAASNVEYFFNKDVNCPQASIDEVNAWNISKFANN